MFKQLFKQKFTWFAVGFYLLLLTWWIKIYLTGEKTGFENYLFGSVYPILALAGAVNGILISRIYGGWASVMGRGIIFLSLALLGQVFGQFAWSYYNIVAKIEVPYPSLADIGYFAVIPFNILAMFSFARASGANFLSSKTYKRSLLIFTVPAVLLALAYFLFLKDNPIDLSQPIKVFLDLGYPLGEAIYISLAILTYVLSKKLLGGIMRSKILLIIFAFVVQFTTDYFFLYSASRNIYYNAGPVDLMYTTSFLVYSLALLNLKLIRID